MRRIRNEKGFALVLTLVVTALLVAVAAEFIHGVYVEASLHRNFVNLQQASLMAESGVKGVARYIAFLRSQPDKGPLYRELAKPFELEDEKGKLSVAIEEENGKINLNAVTLSNLEQNEPLDNTLRQLLRSRKLPEGVLDSLADWVDSDNDPRRDGAEAGYYRTLANPYAPGDKKFESFGELGLVRGLSPALLERLRPIATVFVKDDSIDINAAPPEVLMALHPDMNEGLVQAIIDQRRTKPFSSPGEAANIPGMDRIANEWQWVMAKGSVYRFVSEARVGEAVRIVEAVAEFSDVAGVEPKYLYWREY